MKKNNTPLALLWSAAGISLLAGLLLTLRSVGDMSRTTEVWHKKANDMQEMNSLRAIAVQHRTLLKHYTGYPAVPTPLGELARTAAPGLNLMTRSTETHPTVPGWTARMVSVGLTDITGDDLGRLLDAATAANPPWALLECTVSAASTAGRLSKAELVFETVERQD
ncbi:MAG: hypothetical protein WCO42_06030 [bacterium]